MQRSNVQKHILRLYRELLRAAGDRTSVKEHIQLAFRENATIKRTNYIHIEYLMRRAKRSLQQLKQHNSSILTIKKI